MKTLDCQNVEKWVIEELDQGLTTERMTALDDHCSQCVSCRDIRTEMTTLFSAIAADVPEDPGEEYWKYYHASLKARLQEKKAPQNWWLPWRVAAASALLAMVLLAVTLLTFDRTQKVAAVPQDESSVVMEELYQLYGPVSDETVTPANLQEQALALALLDGREAPDDAIIGWFEVEYEPNHALL